jgi:hypothetical protein
MSTLRVNTIQNQPGTGAPSIDGLAKSWVNFNGTGTVAIRASYNVTSITDNGTGNYTINFTTAMTDANYSWTSLSGSPGVTNGYTIAAVPLASGVSLVTLNTGANLYDPVYVTCSVFR